MGHIYNAQTTPPASSKAVSGKKKFGYFLIFYNLLPLAVKKEFEILFLKFLQLITF